MPPFFTTEIEDDAVLIERDDVSDYNAENILPQSPEEIGKIRKWLEPTDYSNKHGEFRRHLASHMSGTGDWLKSSDTFTTWLHSKTQGTLWIKGIPGSGKSVVSAHLINHLARSHPGTPVLYFYFRQIISANHEPAALLRDWIDQVLDYSPPLQKDLKELIEQRRSLKSLSMDDLFARLRLALCGLPGKAFCVADALDEMDQGNDIFLQALASLGQWKPSKVKVLMTSRPVLSVETPLRQANLLRLRLDEEMVDIDIASFVDRSLLATKFSLAERKLIKEAVPGRANGIFLYAKLAMDAVLERNAQVNKVLDTLPIDLHAMYTRLLHEHGSRSGVPHEIQLLILQWITHATRPLRLLEIAEMICVTYRQVDISNGEMDITAAKSLVRAAAGPLLEILPDETVCVIHHSFTEYLKCITRSELDGGYPILRSGATHARLALACLVYLQAGCLDNIVLQNAQHYDLENYDDRETLSNLMSYSDFHGQSGEAVKEEQRIAFKHPFFMYATANWHVHVAKSCAAGFAQEDTTAAIRRFTNVEHQWKAWLKLRWAKNEQSCQGVTPLHVAARFGLTEYAREMISQRADVNAVDVFGKTPLWWAAKSGHASLIQLLVEAGANPDADEKVSGLKPLHEAARENHAEAVRALLAAGVSPLTGKTMEHPGRRCGNAPRSVGHTPLMYTCQNGHLEALKAFLPYLEDIETVHRALAWSAGSGRSELVKCILQHPGVDVNTKVRGDTALYSACKRKDRDSIVVLLEAGADPAILCSNPGDEFGGFGSCRYGPFGQLQDKTRGFTALHAYCMQDHRGVSSREDDPEKIQEVFAMLLEKGASIHQRTEDGSTALHASVNSAVLTRLLLAAGADPNAVDDNGRAPIHSCTCADSMDVLLQDGQADIDKIGPSGQSPLLCVLGQYNQDVIMKLISHGPKLTVRDNKGDGPLHITLAQSNTDASIVKALLTAGVDPNERNRAGNTPLMVMRMDRHDRCPIIDLLLESGADINARSPSGTTLLFRTLATIGTSDHSDITELIKRGADPGVCDYKGKTLLHHAVATHNCLAFNTDWRRNEVTRLDFALGLVHDKDVLDHDGNTLLHEASVRSGILETYHAAAQIALFHKLVQLGIDINLGNFLGRTVLHILASTQPGGSGSYNQDSQFRDTLAWVISKVDDIDQQDQQGLTALHLASTVSEYTVKRLLDAGADPTLASHDGLTPLHLAARARQCNIIGLLLERIISLTVTAVNAKDVKGRTPLYYACRSGMGEMVKVLLEAGADASDKILFFACADFEKEQALWDQDVHPAYTRANRQAFGMTIDDHTRAHCENVHRNPHELKDTRDTLRLEDILDMLITHGCDTSPLVKASCGPWGISVFVTAANSGFQYTLRCLLNARDGISRDIKRTSTGVIALEEHMAKAQARASTEYLIGCECIQPGAPNESLVKSLLKKRQYSAMKALYDRGVSFLSRWTDNSARCTLEFFAEHGYVALLDTIGGLEANRSLPDGIWHAFNDKLKPGLYRSLDIQALDDANVSTQGTILLSALRRDTPNMDTVRLLVEKFSVDVNQYSWSRSYSANDKYEWTPYESPLHYLAQGKHWWHAALALPYLISKKADLNARDKNGATPLQIALGGPNRRIGAFYQQAARALVLAGADVNAKDNSGNTCIMTAVVDVDMIRLLVKHGGLIDPNAAFKAISTGEIDVLQALLNAGLNPNTRREIAAPSQSSIKKRGARLLRVSRENELPPHEEYLLYAAATSYGASRGTVPTAEKQSHSQNAIKAVNMLLLAGADPFATFETVPSSLLKQRDSSEDTEIDYRGPFFNDGKATHSKTRLTVLHELLANGELVHPILQLKDLDGAQRDAQGRTLLHVACFAHAPSAPIDALYQAADKSYKSQLPSFLDSLLGLGVDPLAADDSGRNVLHHMFANTRREHNPEQNLMSLKLLINRYPTLKDESDNFGNTPLLMAIKFAVQQRDVGPVYALLDAGVDLLAVDKDGNGCLHFLAYCIYTSVSIRSLFTVLLERGLDINLRNKRGETPIFNLNRPSPISGGAKTIADERISAEEALSFFTNAEADLFAIDKQGHGLLHIAARETLEPSKDNTRFAFLWKHTSEEKSEPYIARFEVLMRNGLDPMLEDKQNRTVLDIAAAFGKASVLGLFEKKL